MTSNYKECSNDITSENLKCSVQVYWRCTLYTEKVANKLVLR